MDAILETLRFKYFEEGRRLISDARCLLSDIENDLSQDRYFEELFRIMHTIKGNSAMFEHFEVEEISKKMERIFDLVRTEQIMISNDIVEISYECLNHIETLLGNAKLSDKKLKRNQRILNSRLQKYIEHGTEGFSTIKMLNTIGKLALDSFAILQFSFQDLLPGIFSQNLNDSRESIDTSLL
jgi:two-component system chemotaxis sensor kinase CheA